MLRRKSEVLDFSFGKVGKVGKVGQFVGGVTWRFLDMVKIFNDYNGYNG